MKIESNVPLPARRGVHSEIGKAASQMKEGDSVVLNNSSQAMAMCQALRRRGMTGTMRKLPDETYRVWRMK